MTTESENTNPITTVQSFLDIVGDVNKLNILLEDNAFKDVIKETVKQWKKLDLYIRDFEESQREELHYFDEVSKSLGQGDILLQVINSKIVGGLVIIQVERDAEGNLVEFEPLRFFVETLTISKSADTINNSLVNVSEDVFVDQGYTYKDGKVVCTNFSYDLQSFVVEQGYVLLEDYGTEEDQESIRERVKRMISSMIDDMIYTIDMYREKLYMHLDEQVF